LSTPTARNAKMKLALLCVFTAMAGLTSSCAFTENRLRDVGDIFTITCGIGFGGGLHVGPVSTGAGMVWDVYGLSSGYFGKNQMGHFSSGCSFHLIVIGTEDAWSNLETRNRAKEYNADCYFIGLPVYEQGLKGKPLVPPYFFQFEASAGFFGALRVGFNVAELVDFVLGFAGIDLLRDDVARLEQQENPEDTNQNHNPLPVEKRHGGE